MKQQGGDAGRHVCGPALQIVEMAQQFAVMSVGCTGRQYRRTQEWSHLDVRLQKACEIKEGTRQWNEGDGSKDHRDGGWGPLACLTLQVEVTSYHHSRDKKAAP